MKISFEIDLSDLDTFDKEGHNLMGFLRTNLLCHSLEAKLEAMVMEDGPTKEATLRIYSQNIEAAKRIMKTIKLER